MRETVRITALQDRPSLCLKKGDVMQMELEGDMLVMVYSEQSQGLVTVERVSDE